MSKIAAREQQETAAELLARFAERAGKLGVHIHRVANLDDVAALAATLAVDGGPAGFSPPLGEPWRIALAPALDQAAPALRQHLQQRELPLAEIDPARPTTASTGVSVGISAANYGIAETGSLLVADELPDRLVRMLSPKHIVLLSIAQLLPGLDEAGARLRELTQQGLGQPGRYVSFITGPSRTADIEMSLTVGAHGPAELHVAVLEAPLA